MKKQHHLYIEDKDEDVKMLVVRTYAGVDKQKQL